VVEIGLVKAVGLKIYRKDFGKKKEVLRMGKQLTLLRATGLGLVAMALSVPSVFAETYAGRVDGVGQVEVELVAKGTPKFPRRAQSYGVSGQVTVKFNIDVEGNAVGAVIVESKPRRMFDRSAMRYMETLKFIPYKDNGDAAEVSDVVMNVAYKLQD
jgi:TonB family protein